jgi:hypothetical protein
VHLVTRGTSHSPAVNRLLRVAEQTSERHRWLDGSLESSNSDGLRGGGVGADIGAIDGAYEVTSSRGYAEGGAVSPEAGA